MNFRRITIGADPEVFIVDTTNDKVISSIGIIPGTKGDPYLIPELGKGYGIEIDNILAEYNIPPARDMDEFSGSIKTMLDYLDKYVKKVNPNYTVKCEASRMVDDDQLQSDEAKLFGCSVDYNVYSMGPNPKPKGETTNLRSAGFHIHVGYSNPSIETSLMGVKAMDLFVGVPSVLYDRDDKRRSLYGKAGCFRLTEYGFEYRVLSSKLQEIPDKVYRNTLTALSYLNIYSSLDLIESSNLNEKVQKCINTGDTVMAKAIMSIIIENAPELCSSISTLTF